MWPGEESPDHVFNLVWLFMQDVERIPENAALKLAGIQDIIKCLKILRYRR